MSQSTRFAWRVESEDHEETRTESTRLPVIRNGDPALGRALIGSLSGAIEARRPLTHHHREVAAGLRQHLTERRADVMGRTREVLPRLEAHHRALARAFSSFRERAAAIEDSISLAVATGSGLGELERAVILRMLQQMWDDLEKVEGVALDLALEESWNDLGGEG
ncbi:MAG: hypothetical protein KC731_06935 [Myxococcales bacterium]|nr:hypothetical protein [Myxococcales bacterium]